MTRRITLAALIAAACAGTGGDDTPPPVEGHAEVVRVAFPFAAVDTPASSYLQTRGHLDYACDPDTPEAERSCPLDIAGARWDAEAQAFTRRRADGGATAEEPFGDDILWERPLYAPIAGRVIACWRGMPDDDDDDDDTNCPGGDKICTPAGNFVTILGDDGTLVSLCHLRAESVPLSVCPIDERYLYADGPKRCTLGGRWSGFREASRLDLRGLDEPTIAVGEYVGQVGTSGSGKGVHLHIHAKPYRHDGENHCEGPSLPLAIERAEYARVIDGVDPDEADWEALAGDVLPIDGSSLLLRPADPP